MKLSHLALTIFSATVLLGCASTPPSAQPDLRPQRQAQVSPVQTQDAKDADLLASGSDKNEVTYYLAGLIQKTDIERQNQARIVVAKALQIVDAKPPTEEDRSTCSERLTTWAREYGKYHNQNANWIGNCITVIGRIASGKDPLSLKDIEIGGQWFWQFKGEGTGLEAPYIDSPQQTLCRRVYLISLAHWDADRSAGKVDPEHDRVVNQETAFKTSVEKCKATWNVRECALPELSELQRSNCRDACFARMDAAFADEERNASNRCAEEYVKSDGKTGTACTLNIPTGTSIATTDLNAASQRCSMTCSDEAPKALKKAKLGPRLERETANIKRNYRLCMVNAWHSVPKNYKSDRGLRVERMAKETESCRKQMGCDDFEEVTGEACESDLAWTTDSHY